jgi:hypothetical protein
MHKRRLLLFREPQVFTILQRQLVKKGYRVCPKVRLSDAIGKDDGERLAEREFDYFTRAHLDFLVVKDFLPVFAVEFDGAGHNAPNAAKRDVLKNRLCKAAGLPLLRVTSREISGTDDVTLLDYMLMRHVAWTEEIDGITAEIREWAENIPPDTDPEDLAVDLDPSFHFDVRHPFPGVAAVHERLWRKHRIAWDGSDHRRFADARFVCSISLGSCGSLHDDQFVTHVRQAALWPPGRPSLRDQPPIFSQEVEVTLRAYLPLRTDVPPPPFFTDWADALAAVEQARVRAESMWMPWLPGVSVYDVAENYAEYLGLRAIERWARQNLTASVAAE